MWRPCVRVASATLLTSRALLGHLGQRQRQRVRVAPRCIIRPSTVPGNGPKLIEALGAAQVHLPLVMQDVVQTKQGRGSTQGTLTANVHIAGSQGKVGQREHWEKNEIVLVYQGISCG
ncbi:hypothetical protein BKA63DRAFT_490649 [Paraphoma chrysanthemicola]|nr:hypothetical protein BKA63DRAFT_490649 [Paraphoma chrysanthemicola]